MAAIRAIRIHRVAPLAVATAVAEVIRDAGKNLLLRFVLLSYICNRNSKNTYNMTINELERIASQVRRDIIRMVHGCQSGHPGGSLGATDIVTALYFDQMQIDPANFRMDGNGEDMFFLSNGHISPMFYSILARRGYFPVSELATFRRLGTRLQGHPTTAEGLPGVRIASGSLGQGLSVAVGAAQAKRLNGDKHLVFVLMGDGEQEEGRPDLGGRHVCPRQRRR